MIEVRIARIEGLDDSIHAKDVADGLRDLLPTDKERFCEELVRHSDRVTIVALHKALSHD